MSLKEYVYNIIEKNNSSYLPSKIFDFTIIILVILNVAVIILETERDLAPLLERFLYKFEIITISIFTIELILRVWTATSNPKYKHPISGRIRFIFTPLIIIDILAIIPFYLPMFISFDLRILRIVRLYRLFTFFKIARYSTSFSMIIKVISSKKEELLITVMSVGVLLILASTLIYYAENDAQPELFPSIISSMWWGVATLTTVGYGDVYPITSVGKLIGTIISILGVGIVAMPAGIIASGFVEAIERKKKHLCCPNCGHDFDNE